MSKKTLLNEGTVRRFMKLAEIEPLTRTFFENYSASEETLEEEGLYEYDDDGLLEEDDFILEDEDDPMSPPEEGDLEGDLEGEEDLGDLEGEGEEDPLGELSTELADVIADKLREMESEGALEISTGEPTEEVDLSVEEPEEGDEDLGDLEGEPEEGEPGEEEMVTEIARRVAKRILSTKKRR